RVTSPRFSIMTANTYRIMIAPAYTITSSAAANGAPSVKNTPATASSDTIRYRSACIAFTRVIGRIVGATATIDQPEHANVMRRRPIRRAGPSSRRQPPYVARRGLVLGLALVLAPDRKARDAVEAVAGILAGAADQKVLLLVHHVAAVVFAHLEIGRELDRVRRTRFLAESAVDAAREVDAEPGRVPAPGLVLGLRERDAVDGTGDRAGIAGDAALLPVRIPGEDDPAAKARREIRLLLGIQDRLALAEAMQEDAEH